MQLLQLSSDTSASSEQAAELELSLKEELTKLVLQHKKIWQRQRQIVYTIWSETLYFPQFPYMTYWLEAAVGDSQARHLLCELQAARVEVLLEIPLSSCSYSEWTSLFRLNPYRRGPLVQATIRGQKGKITSFRIDEERKEKLQKLWTETLAVAKSQGRAFPHSEDLRIAGQYLHMQNPEKFAPPLLSEKDKLRLAANQLLDESQNLEANLQKLQLENLELREEIQNLQKGSSYQELADAIRKFHYRCFKLGEVSPAKALNLLLSKISEEKEEKEIENL